MVDGGKKPRIGAPRSIAFFSFGCMGRGNKCSQVVFEQSASLVYIRRNRNQAKRAEERRREWKGVEWSDTNLLPCFVLLLSENQMKQTPFIDYGRVLLLLLDCRSSSGIGRE